jgi:hypothetical protein
VKVTITFGRLTPNPARPTIAEALQAKLGREPTHHELTADVRRILRDGRDEARSSRGRR